MNKTGIALIAIAIIGVVTFSNFSVLNGLSEEPKKSGLTLTLPSFSLDSFRIPMGKNISSVTQAWKILGEYLEFAKNHDLVGLRSVSHQISPTCNDQSRESECFALMDSVYTFMSAFTEEEFKNVAEDKHQVILYTDGPERKFLYFTHDESGTLKLLGLRFCLDDEATGFDCVAVNASKVDTNTNGWWDSVESLFYKEN